jgi:hypothetical protein
MELAAHCGRMTGFKGSYVPGRTLHDAGQKVRFWEVITIAPGWLTNPEMFAFEKAGFTVTNTVVRKNSVRRKISLM